MSGKSDVGKTTVSFVPDSVIFETIEFSFDTILIKFRELMLKPTISGNPRDSERGGNQ